LEALIGIPTITIFVMILFGVLSELSQPTQSTSTDLVNWLPISPSEYVFGSTVAISYTYSFLLAFFLGIAVGPSLYFGHWTILLLSAVMGTLSLLIGSTAIELLRTLTNRISSSFYKKSGRSGIILRLGFTIALLVVFQLLFSSRIIVTLLNGLTQTVSTIWYVPVLWPSLAVQMLARSSLASVTLGIASLGFILTLFGLSVYSRRIFWVPVPVSIRLSTQPYRPMHQFEIPGLDVAESAIVRKDIRSLTRRREMARFLAIPFVLAVSMWVSVYPFGNTTSSTVDMATAIPLYLIPVAIFCSILSMTSIGQEGAAVWHLYAAPLTPNQVVRAKMFPAIIMGTLFMLALLAAMNFLFKPVPTQVLDLLLLGLIVVLEESTLGIYIGAKFPDFREMIRSRYVSVGGSLFGTTLGLAIALFTASPFLLADIFQPILPARALAIIIGAAVFSMTWKLASRQVTRLFNDDQQ
jgi:hypothetical protein